ncbi:MAG TPA: tyrosine-type recombinase/integrase [Azospirillum sp.]
MLAVAEMAALFTAVNLDHLYTYLRNVGRHVQDIGRAFDRARDRAGLGKDVSPYTIRHTMATELRMRGVAVWDVAGWLGHSSGYKTTERYAKTNPEALAGAPRATDAYFADLAAAMEATRPVLSPTPVRASRVLPGQAEGAALQRSPLRKLVEPRRIELLTSTMPLLGRSSVDMRQDATI